MQIFNVAGNFLTGSVPRTLGEAVLLEVLYMYDNLLSSTLPVDMEDHNITALQYFSLNSNFLSGVLSRSLTELPALQSFEINSNFFSGENVLSLGINKIILYVDTSSNLFTGTLPTDWSRFINVQYLLLDDNFINGTISNSVGLNNTANVTTGNSSFVATVRSFIQFSMSNNLLEGTIPSSLATHTNLTLLSLGNNFFAGTLPSEFCSLSRLITLNISNNNLAGDILGMFGEDEEVRFPSLTYVSLGNNSFDSSIPPSLFMSSLLEVVSLSTNCFTGSLPDTICYSSVLQSVVINAASSSAGCKVGFDSLLSKIFKGTFSTKRLVAKLPSCLWNVDSLQTLHMAGNGLSGSIPDAPLPSSLLNLQLGYNALTGTIPNHIQERGGFVSLGLQHNKLTGTLSSSFSVAPPESSNTTNSSLQLDLNVNRLSGVVPAAFSSLTDVDILTGNLFECVSNADLPPQDPSSKNYVCGSSGFDVSVYIWAGAVGIQLLFSFACVIFVYYVSNYTSKGRSQLSRGATASSTLTAASSEGSSPRSAAAEGPSSTTETVTSPTCASDFQAYVIRIFFNTLQWYQFKYPSGRDKFQHTFQFLTVLTRASQGIRQIAAAYIIVCMSTYMIMKYARSALSQDSIATVFRQAGWITTSSYMHGVAPAVVVLLFLFISLYLIATQIRSKDWDQIAAMNRMTNETEVRSSDAESSANSVGQSETTSSKMRLQELVRMMKWSGVKVVVFQICNICVTIAVNVLYVEALQYQKLLPMQQTFLELALSMFKLGWGATYIPWTVRNLYDLSVAHRLCHQVFMFCFLIIIAPLIASATGAQSCFTNAFAAYSPVQSSYSNIIATQICTESVTLTVANDGIVTSKLDSVCIFESTLANVIESTVPPFIYSYQCGSTLLANYIPVLMYSYIFSSIFLPFIRVVMLHSSQSFMKAILPRLIYRSLVTDTLLDCEDIHSILPHTVAVKADSASKAVTHSLSSLPRFSGNQDNPDKADQDVENMTNSSRSAVSFSSSSCSAPSPAEADGSLMNHTHNPLIASVTSAPQSPDKEAIKLSQIKNMPSQVNTRSSHSAYLNRLSALFPERKSDSTDDLNIRTQPLFDGSNVVAKKLLDFGVMLSFGLAAPILGLAVAFSVFVNTGVWRVMIGKYLSFYAAGNTIARERLEASSDGLLLGAVSGMWVVTVVVLSFWCLMIYDMVADLYGVTVGIITIACVFSLMPVVLLAALRLYDASDVADVVHPVTRRQSAYIGAIERVRSAQLSMASMFPMPSPHTSTPVDASERSVNSNFAL
jgi:hypothetical protein